MQRRPTPADASSPLPSLDDLRAPPSHAANPARRAVSLGVAAGVAAAAGGAVYAAESPVCGSTRAEELAAHSSVAGQSLRRGDLAQTLREMGLALGWVHHAGAGVSPEGPEILSPGEAPMVTPQPPAVPRSGGMVPVDPTPPPADVDGGIRAVQPTPPTQPHRPRVTPPATPRPPARGGIGRTAPVPRDRLLGDVSQVSLQPPDATRRG